MKKRVKKIDWKILIASLIIVYAVAFIGSLFTAPATDTDWYQSIRPSITPPNWVFPVVWNILFFLIALSMYFACTSTENKSQKIKIRIVFITNFILNILWSALYFGLKNPALAFIEIIVLWLSILSIILVVRKTSNLSAWLIVPYLLWVAFAAVLNFLSI